MDMDGTKQCPECGQDKALSAFKRQRKSHDGYQHRCKDCALLRAMARDERFMAAVRERGKVCARCGELKPRAEFWNNVRRKDGLQTYCKRCFIDGTAGHRARAQLKSLEMVEQGLVTTKRCSVCRQDLPLAAFRVAPHNYYGVSARCKTCLRVAERTAWQEGRGVRRAADNLDIKREVLAHYCGADQPACACCATAYLPHLTLDHIAGDGALERKRLGISGGTAFYRQLRRAGYPAGYRVLCFNCNVASFRLPGGCRCRDIDDINSRPSTKG